MGLHVKRSGIALVTVSLLAGCVSVRPLDVSGGSANLEGEEGILVLHVRTDLELARLDTSAGTLVEDLDPGEHLLFFRATSGEYRWTRAYREIGGAKFWYDMRGLDFDVHFSIEAGAVNYPGMLIFTKGDLVVSRTVSAYSMHPQLLNRSAQTLRALEREYPELLKRYPLRWAGPNRDDFLERYFEARGAPPHAAASGGAK